MQPEMKPVGSSLIQEVGYDEEKKELWVRFHEGGLYIYSDVPQEVFEEMLNVRSVGRYFLQNIKHQCPHRKDEVGVY